MFGGPWRLSVKCLETLISSGLSPLLVAPPFGLVERFRRLAGRPLSPIEQVARGAGIDILRYGSGGELEAAICRFRPDLICIATFPELVPARITDLASRGAINLHPSLLPRHRGSEPLFWTYYHDDREAGLTVHRATDRLDAGPIILQERVCLARGYPIEALASDLIDRSGPMLVRAIEAVLAGQAEVDQNEAEATRAPKLGRSRPRIPLDEWDVERVWHFLAGVASRHREPLIDQFGRPVPYRSATAYRRGPGGRLGEVTRHADGWTLQCVNGVVSLA